MENTALLLRKLSCKSTLKFGKYSKYTVEQLISWKKESYLVWGYYNLDTISFCDDLLELLHIYEERKIPKPGKDKNSVFIKIITQELRKPLTKEEIIEKKANNKIKKALLKKEAFGKFRHVESKASLQRKNQGKR